MKKLIKTIITVILLMSVMCVPVCAAESNVQPRYAYIDSITMSFDVDGNNRSDCYAKVVTYNSSHKIVLSMQLQYYTGAGWKDLDSWVTPKTAGTVSLYKTPYVPAGYSYRLAVNVIIYDTYGNIIESQTKYATA